MALTDKKKPQKAHGVLAGILLVGWAIAFTVPRTPTGKLLVFIVVMVIAVAAFIVLFNRAQKEKAEREAELFLERTLRERGVPVPASPPAAAPVAAQRWSLELLQRLEARRLEALCAAYFQAHGFRVQTAPLGANEGNDINLFAEGAAKPSMVVQCKAGNSAPVGIKPIRELIGVMALERIPQGTFVTAGAFSGEARQLAARLQGKVHFIDGKELLAKIDGLAPEKAQALLRLATG